MKKFDTNELQITDKQTIKVTEFNRFFMGGPN